MSLQEAMTEWVLMEETAEWPSRTKSIGETTQGIAWQQSMQATDGRGGHLGHEVTMFR